MKDFRLNILSGVIAVALLAILFVDPIPQDPQYHQFADQRTLFGIPHMWNVLSNLPFILVGLLGLRARDYAHFVRLSGSRRMIYSAFFVGLILTGLGSAYYHLSPNNDTLVWDRLSMVVSFVAFFAFVLSMHLNERIAARLFWPLMFLAVASVLYWAYSEKLGHGDLRLYAIVQFLPMILVPLIMLLFPQPAYRSLYVWLLIAGYVAAKLAEHFDYPIYQFCGISGHAWKHMIAALPGLALLQAFRSFRYTSS